jgi:hypothetical protein
LIQGVHLLVTPAQAGVQGDLSPLALDSRFRGNDDGKEGTFGEKIKPPPALP